MWSIFRKISRKFELKRKQARLKVKMEKEGRATGTRSARDAIAALTVTPRPIVRRVDMTPEQRRAHDNAKRKERENRKHPRVKKIL